MLCSRSIKNCCTPPQGLVIAWLIYILGAFWRAWFVFIAHDPRHYINSDMSMYVQHAKRFVVPDTQLSIHDVNHSPGVGMILGFFYSFDQSFVGAVIFQYVIALLIPLSIAFLARRVFDEKTALYALAISSIYLPFGEYAGYFLAEIYFILLVSLFLTLFFSAQQQSNPWMARFEMAICGFVYSIGIAFKFIIFPATLCLMGCYVALHRSKQSHVYKLGLCAFLVIGALPISIYLARRCTNANAGQLCLVSNESGAVMLLGHSGRVQGLRWRDKKSSSDYTFISPAAYLRQYIEIREVPFSLYDAKANRAEAIKWILNNPVDTLIVSADHVYDTFIGIALWPNYASRFVGAGNAFHYAYLVLVLFPVLGFFAWRIWKNGVLHVLGSREFLFVSPIAGLVAAVIATTGEPRFRIPFDGILIVMVSYIFANYLDRSVFKRLIYGPPSEPMKSLAMPSQFD